jgi:hypothetical protein
MAVSDILTAGDGRKKAGMPAFHRGERCPLSLPRRVPYL